MQSDVIEGFHLSPQQRRLWTLQKLGSPLLSSFGILIRGNLDARALDEAIRKVIRKHEILRTTFHDLGGLEFPLQVVASDERTSYRELSRLQSALKSPQEEFDRLIALQSQESPDLQEGPLLRCSLSSLTESQHLLAVSLPSLCADLESLNNLTCELGAAYAAALEGAEFSQEAIQYVQYSEWRNEQEDQEQPQEDDSNEDGPTLGAALRLPGERKEDAAALSFPAPSLTLAIGEEQEEAIAQLSDRRQVSPESFWLACWQVLLRRLTGERQVVTGYVFDGREFDDLRESIGPYAFPVSVATRLERDFQFLEAMADVDRALERIRSGEDATAQSDAPSTTAPLQFESHRPAWLSANGISIRMLCAQSSSDAFKLKLSLSSQTERSHLRLYFDPSLFSVDASQRILDSLKTLAQAALQSPDELVDRLGILSQEDRSRLVLAFNATDAPLNEGELLHELIDRLASESPDETALIGSDESLSRSQLKRRSDQLARRLSALGAEPEQRVAVCLSRSCRLPAAVLGVLKSGAAYLPLDPDDPPERIGHVLDDARPSLLLAEAATLGRIPQGPWQTLRLDRPLPQDDGLTDPPRPRGGNAAYLIYTSGSTGRPKGVCVSHRSLLNYLLWARGLYRPQQGEGAALHSPVAFDLSVTSLFLPLLSGRPLRVLPAGPESQQQLDELLHSRLSFLKATPSHLDLLAERLLSEGRSGAAQVLIAGGEAVQDEQAQAWRRAWPRSRIVNEYGPTEATVGCCAWELQERSGQAGPVPIGKPIANARLYLLDAWMQPLPAEARGELHVAGECLARGYHRSPGRTAERFLPDPFSQRPGGRLYRTGDWARFDDAGQLVCLGRADEQLKIRGYRVEPGEVEAALRSHPAVREAAAAAGGEAGRKRLAAYLVWQRGERPSAAQLRRFLAARLPEYMIPARFVSLEALPLARSGKVDRKALPEPDDSRDELGAIYQPPQNLTQELLTTIWSEVLDIDRIGIDDNFFVLGGDSIRSIRIRSLAQQRGLAISHQDLFRHQTIRDLSLGIGSSLQGDSEAGSASSQPFELILQEDRAKLPEGAEDAYPLAALQAGMVFHSELRPESAVFHDVHTIDLRIPFDSKSLEQALDHLLARHPVLRSGFDLASFSQPLQIVYREVSPPLQIEDLRQLPQPEQEEQLQQWLQEEKHRPFDWTRPPMLRFHVHRRSDETCRFGFSFHHAVLDGWSVATLLTELFRTYLSFLDEAQPPPLPEIAATFRDFVALERETLESDQARAFWRDELEDCSASLLPRMAAPTEGGGSGIHIEEISISEEVSDQLKKLSRSISVPIKSVLLMAHLRAIAHVMGQSDVITGLVCNGRPEETGGDRVAGLFLNTLPFRAKLGGSWEDQCKRVFETERAMLPHRRYPLSALQQEQGGGRLFESAFNFMHFHVYQTLENLRGDVELLDWGGYEETDFPLTANFSMDLATSKINLRLNCHLDRLGRQQIESIAESYARTLEAICDDPSADMGAVALLSRRERDVLDQRNRTDREFQEGGLLVHELIDGLASESPDETALIGSDESLSRSQLKRRSDQLARRLSALGAEPEQRVAVCLSRSCRLPAAVLGVLKSGAAYLPLDPDDPPERIGHVLDDARPSLLLAEAATLGRIPQGPWQTLRLDRPLPQDDGLTDPPRPRGGNAAYLIYTSGSTGRPKGVCVSHRSLLNYLLWARGLYRPQQGEGAALHSPVAFDLSVTSLFLPLLSGRPLRVLPAGPESQQQLDELLHSRLSFLKATPSHLDLLAERLLSEGRSGAAQVLIAGGEAVQDEQAQAWRRAWPRSRIVNEYGPTEATVGCCAWELQERSGQAGPVPIGKPIANARLYLLDAWMQPLPAEARGELHVAGECLARGYHRSPGRTAERFLPDPFSQRPGGRLYRTGDWARFDDAGQLVCLGRADEQLKIRGYRVEPGEVEAALRSHPAVREAAAAAGGEAGRKRLAAYLVWQRGERPSAAQLRRFLAARLPEYMIPARFVSLEALPLARSGKVDRKALPELDRERPELDVGYVEPQTDLQRDLVGIWSEVLGVERLGIADNFFQLGGHSLVAIQAISRIRQTLNVDLPLRQLFDFPTIEGLSARISELEASSSGRADDTDPIARRPTLPIEAAGEVDLDGLLAEIEGLDESETSRRLEQASAPEADVNPLSYDQERIWRLEERNEGQFRYSMSFMFRLNGALDAAALERSVKEIVNRHEVLRSSFRIHGGQPAQVVSASSEIRLRTLDLSEKNQSERERVLQHEAADEARRPFDLATGPMVRALLFRLTPDEHVLLMAMHAIVMDGWSMGVLLRELALLYQAFSQGRPSPLQELPIQVADYASWERDRIGKRRLGALLDYWLNQLPGPIRPVELPFVRDGAPSAKAATESQDLPPDLSRRIREFGQEHGLTPFMVALAGFKLLLHLYSGQSDICIGVGVALRTRVETESLIGSFMNLLFFRTDFSGDPTFSQALEKVRDVTLGAFAHQELPWIELEKALHREGRLEQGPPTRIMFDHLSASSGSQEVAGLKVTPVAPERQQLVTGSDLTFRLQEQPESMATTVFYKSDLFDVATIRKLLVDFHDLIVRGLDDPDRPVSTLLAPR